MRSSTLALLSVVSYSALVSAQSFTPVQASFSASAIAENQGFYILGGYNNNLQTSQLLDQAFYIDLSKSWNTANPPFQQLPNGNKVYRTASTVSKDNKKWIVFSNSTAYAFDIPSSNWTTVGGSASISASHGLVAVTDPKSGIIYVPNGFGDVFTGQTKLLEFDTTKDVIASADNYPGLINTINFGAAWSSSIDSLVVFGGNMDGSYNANNNLLVYNSKNGWTTPTAKGDIPEPRLLPCFSTADSGSKIILFGGIGSSATNQSGPGLADVYTLDVGSWTWKKGTDSPSGARKFQSCGVSGEYLISWGGVSDSPTSGSNSTLLYNWKSGTWTNDYTPSKALSSSKVAIIAGCVGGVVLIALIVGALFWRRRRSGKKSAKKAPFLHQTNNQGQKPGELIALVPNDQLYAQTHQHNTQQPFQQPSSYQPQVQQGQFAQPDQLQHQQQGYPYQGQVSQAYQPQVSQAYQSQVPQVSQAYQPPKQEYEPSPVPSHSTSLYPSSYGQGSVTNQAPVSGPPGSQAGPTANYGQQPVYGQQTYQQQGYQQ